MYKLMGCGGVQKSFTRTDPFPIYDLWTLPPVSPAPRLFILYIDLVFKMNLTDHVAA